MAAQGQDPEELEFPAPTVTITAAEEGGGHGDDAAVTESSDDDRAALAVSEDKGGNTLGAVGLGAGVLGLLAGGTALVRVRRRGSDVVPTSSSGRRGGRPFGSSPLRPPACSPSSSRRHQPQPTPPWSAPTPLDGSVLADHRAGQPSPSTSPSRSRRAGCRSSTPTATRSHRRHRPATTVVTVEVPDHLSDGTYVVVWRIISADGHPVARSLTFSVGKPSTRVVSPEPPEPAGPSVTITLSTTHAMTYIGAPARRRTRHVHSRFCSPLRPEPTCPASGSALSPPFPSVVSVVAATSALPLTVIDQQGLGLADVVSTPGVDGRPGHCLHRSRSPGRRAGTRQGRAGRAAHPVPAACGSWARNVPGGGFSGTHRPLTFLPTAGAGDRARHPARAGRQRLARRPRRPRHHPALRLHEKPGSPDTLSVLGRRRECAGRARHHRRTGRLAHRRFLGEPVRHPVRMAAHLPRSPWLPWPQPLPPGTGTCCYPRTRPDGEYQERRAAAAQLGASLPSRPA